MGRNLVLVYGFLTQAFFKAIRLYHLWFTAMLCNKSDFTPMAIRLYSRKSYRRGKAARRSRKYRRSGGRRRSTYGISSASNRYSRETSVFSTSLSAALTPTNVQVVAPTDV